MTETPDPDGPQYLLRFVNDEDGRDMELQHIALTEGLPDWPPPQTAFVFRGRFTYADWVTAQIGFIAVEAPPEFVDELKAMAAANAADSPFDVVELLFATQQSCSQLDPREQPANSFVMPGAEYRITDRHTLLKLNGSGGDSDAADPS